MKESEKAFEHELEVLRTESNIAIQFFYASIAINDVIADNEKALKIVNETPLFWNLNKGALQEYSLVVLGRVFDQGKNHNIDRLIKIAQDNSDIFSKEALEARKRKQSSNTDKRIEYNMDYAYVPTPKDFRRLRKYVNKYRKIYNNNYRKIRNKLYAHLELSDPLERHELFAKTNIREFEKLLVFLLRLHKCLWELLNNGKNPVLKPMRYSLKAIRKAKIPEWQSMEVHERVVYEVEEVFRILCSG